jgi:Flp pilus assembly protein TadD
MKPTSILLALLVSAEGLAGPPWRSEPPQGRSAKAKRGDAKAHFDRGLALYDKSDLDGAIAEYRAAIRLKPEAAEAHSNLGVALEAKREKQAALAEYRQASELDSTNEKFRADYERLAKELGK